MSKKPVGNEIVRNKCLILIPKSSYNMKQNLTLIFFLLLVGQQTMASHQRAIFCLYL